MITLSLVIPCYNEAKSLPAFVARCAEVFTQPHIEVILVDNGSTDDTPAVMASVLAGLPPGTPIRSLRVAPNRGYGGGIMAGLDAANGRIMCLVPGSRDATLTGETEDALWQAVFTAQPERRREFEPSSKRRKKRPASWPSASA